LQVCAAIAAILVQVHPAIGRRGQRQRESGSHRPVDKCRLHVESLFLRRFVLVQKSFGTT